MCEQLGKFILDLISNHLHHSVIPIQACTDFIAFAGDCEKQWAQKITVEWRKEQFLAIWGFVRRQIASYLNCSPSEIIFDRTSYGKPFLKFPGSHFSFNISHTKNHLAICYGNQCASCGIDIEIVRDMPDRLSIAERFFAKEEFMFLSQLESEKKQNDYFFKLWVIKEAILKTLGKGLSYGLDKVFIDGFEKQKHGVIDLVCDQKIKKIAWQFFQEASVNYVKAVALEMD
jgi:phosphopantetheine--protein transferase-like protein